MTGAAQSGVATQVQVASEPWHIVGREGELRQLDDALTQAIATRGCTLLVTGEPGIGKTTLVDEFILRARRRPEALLVVRGRCVEQYGAGETYLPASTRSARCCRERVAPGWPPSSGVMRRCGAFSFRRPSDPATRAPSSSRRRSARPRTGCCGSWATPSPSSPRAWPSCSSSKTCTGPTHPASTCSGISASASETSGCSLLARSDRKTSSTETIRCRDTVTSWSDATGVKSSRCRCSRVNMSRATSTRGSHPMTSRTS
ncbi:MAG: ATP-binding protein [Acidobacteria bacterium]|nr:ATP-binding protein [Acidobacteriota bacterium]